MALVVGMSVKMSHLSAQIWRWIFTCYRNCDHFSMACSPICGCNAFNTIHIISPWHSTNNVFFSSHFNPLSNSVIHFALFCACICLKFPLNYFDSISFWNLWVNRQQLKKKLRLFFHAHFIVNSFRNAIRFIIPLLLCFRIQIMRIITITILNKTKQILIESFSFLLHSMH